MRAWFFTDGSTEAKEQLNSFSKDEVEMMALAIDVRVQAKITDTRKAVCNKLQRAAEDQPSWIEAERPRALQGEAEKEEEDEHTDSSPSPPPPRSAGFASARPASGRSSPRRHASSRALQALSALPPVSDRAVYGAPSPAPPRSILRSAPLARAPTSSLSPSTSSARPRAFVLDGSSSDSEEEDAGVESGRLRRSELASRMAGMGLDDRLWPEFVEAAQRRSGGRSLLELYKFDMLPHFPSTASAHSKAECLSLARIIDAALASDLDAVLEQACRRLGGLQTAVDTGNWMMCERLEAAMDARSFVPARFLSSALKSVSREQAIRKLAPTGKHNGTGGGKALADGHSGNSSWAGRSGKRPSASTFPPSESARPPKTGGGSSGSNKK